MNSLFLFCCRNNDLGKLDIISGGLYKAIRFIGLDYINDWFKSVNGNLNKLLSKKKKKHKCITLSNLPYSS